MLEFILLAIETEEDREYFADILEQYQPALFIHINQLVQNEHDSWDCYQNAIISVMENFDRFMELDRTFQIAYLYVSCRNAALKYFRSKNKQIKHEISTTDPIDGSEIDIPDPNEDIQKAYIIKEAVQMVLKLLKGMGEESRILAFYKFIVGYSDKKGAEIMGISPGNYRERVYRIRKKLGMEITL